MKGVWVLLHLMHTSLQFSDTPAQQRSDLTKIFNRARKRKVAWISGTEAGPGTTNRKLLSSLFGRLFNRRIVAAKDCWIAVDRSRIKRGTFTWDEIVVIDNDLTKGRGHDSIILWARWFDVVLNRYVCAATSHYPTQGGRPGDPNWKWNKAMAQAVGRLAAQMSKGSDIFFHSADYNMSDRRSDWYFGEDLTSVGDELNQHPGTGHGDIDGFGTTNRDRGVRAAYVRALNDREFPLHTDHYPYECGVDVRVLAS